MIGGMTLAPHLQPDQNPQAWNDHVGVYEAAFEPLTNIFAAAALDRLGPLAGRKLIDIAAGSGGAALDAARRGAQVTAIDAAAAMVARIAGRAAQACPGRIEALQMDAACLALPDAGFDAALSVFGIVLLPDVAAGMAQMRRVLKPGGQAAIVTWTQPQRYELAARLAAAIVAVRGAGLPSSALPAQLRYADPAVFRAMIEAAGFAVEAIDIIAAKLVAPSAAWLGERLGFAPGLAAMMAALGDDRAAVTAHFVQRLQADQGCGQIALESVAHVALARA